MVARDHTSVDSRWSDSKEISKAAVLGSHGNGQIPRTSSGMEPGKPDQNWCYVVLDSSRF